MAKALSEDQHKLMIQARNNEHIPLEVDGEIYLIPRRVNEVIYSLLRKAGDYDGPRKDYEMFTFKGAVKSIGFEAK